MKKKKKYYNFSIRCNLKWNKISSDMHCFLFKWQSNDFPSLFHVPKKLFLPPPPKISRCIGNFEYAIKYNVWLWPTQFSGSLLTKTILLISSNQKCVQIISGSLSYILIHKIIKRFYFFALLLMETSKNDVQCVILYGNIFKY